MQTYALPAVTLELAASCLGAGESLQPPPDGWGQQSTELDVRAQTLPLIFLEGGGLRAPSRNYGQRQPLTPQGHSLGLSFFLFLNIYLLRCTRSWWQHAGSSIFIAASETFSCSIWDLVP